MKKRLDNIKRIQSVQEKLRTLAEAKLADLERQEAALKVSRGELVAALNEDQALHGLFLDAMARRVKTLSLGISHLEKAKETQAKEVLDHSSKLKRVERIAGTLGRDYTTALEKKDLAELIDRLKPSGASLP